MVSAIVTGSDSAIALRLAASGVAVVLVYLNDARAADALVDEILAGGGTALTLRADLEDALDVERAFDETVAAFGAVDLVLHTQAGDTALIDAEAERQGVAVIRPAPRAAPGVS